MRIVVIGAGAIGGVTAAYMAMNGIDVTLVCKRQNILDGIRRAGVHIVGKRGEHFIGVKISVEQGCISSGNAASIS